MATASPRLITVDEFLAIRWDDSDVKAELDNGVIRIMRMMAGGSIDHSRVQGNIFGALFAALDDSPCRPHGSDMAVVIDEFSVRYPDVSVFCGHDGIEEGSRKALDDPQLVVEVLSPSTRNDDLGVKLAEYQSLSSLAHILYVDPEDETACLWTRTGPHCWNEAELQSGDGIQLTALNVALQWDQMFRRKQRPL